MKDSNFVIDSKAAKYFWKGEGLFSIKSFNGEAFYNVGNGNYRLTNSTYLLLNHKQEYSISIDAKQDIQSFTIFFSSELINTIHYSHIEGYEKSLANYTREKQAEFFVRNYDFSKKFFKIYSDFKNHYQHNKTNKLWLEEKLNIIGEQIVLENLNNFKSVDRVNYSKASTRKELYKRALIAKEYLFANFDNEVSLNEVSRVSSLSVNNLIKIFQHFFGKTPHQYLVHIRVNHAMHLLSTTELSLEDVVLKVGFSSVPSFATLFHKIAGLTPMQYKKSSNSSY
jgi:AraC-like DNA-binding protein